MIPVFEPKFWGNEKKYLINCIETGWISSAGKFICEFEQKFAKYLGIKHAIACSNATTGLFISMKAMGLKSGEEVIIPDHTIIVSANTIIHAGGKPVPVDVDIENYCMDPTLIEEKISSKTRFIMPVHMYGHPCEMQLIMDIAKKYNLDIIEDCAEAIGSEVNGKKVGTFGRVSVFSFYANKAITCGEGGMICTNDDKLAEKIRLLINQAYTRPRGKHWEIGYNFRMTNMQAAVGVAQLEYVEEIIKSKRILAKNYNKLLKDTKGIILPIESSWAKHTYWMYGIVLKRDLKITRDEVCKKLNESGIDTRLFFYPIHKQPVFLNNHLINPNTICPNSEFLADRGFYLPSSLTLTKKQLKFITQTLKFILK